jgi:hypothetical protein
LQERDVYGGEFYCSLDFSKLKDGVNYSLILKLKDSVEDYQYGYNEYLTNLISTTSNPDDPDILDWQLFNPKKYNGKFNSIFNNVFLQSFSVSFSVQVGTGQELTYYPLCSQIVKSISNNDYNAYRVINIRKLNIYFI